MLACRYRFPCRGVLRLDCGAATLCSCGPSSQVQQSSRWDHAARALLLSLLLFLFFRPSEIVMLDVAQGDAFLVRSKGSALLIDTGNHDTLLKEALARQGIFHLDAVLITHADDDHCGSLQALTVSWQSIACSWRAMPLRECKSCENLIKNASSVVGCQRRTSCYWGCNCLRGLL